MNFPMVSYVTMLLCVATFVAATPDGTPATIVPEAEVAPLYEQQNSLFDELLEESEMVQVDATVSAKAGNDQAESMVEAIADLKSYCIAAKKLIAHSDELKGSGHLKNGVFMFIDAFGDETDKELVTEYAEVIGDLKAAHPVHAGIEGYMLDHLNENVLHLKKIVQIGLSGDGSLTGKTFLRFRSFGFRQQPEYFKKLAVSLSDYQAAHTALHKGKNGAAIAAWKKGGSNIPDDMYAKVFAKYSAMQQAHDMLAEAGAKVAIRASYEGSKEKEGVEPIGALPVAGAKGGLKVREMKNFQMPSKADMKKEAMKMAKDYMQKLAEKGDSPAQIVKLIEAKLQGVNIRVTTGAKMFAESNQVPSVKIVGDYGTIEGKLEALPMGGHTSTTNYVLDGGKPIGKVKRITLTNDDDVTNPWLCTKFEVQVGHGNPWINFLPNGKKSFVDGFWVDGSDGKLGPFYRLARDKKWLMMPFSANLVYKKKIAGKAPRCADITASDLGGTACFSGTQLEFQKKCDAYPKCQGYTYTINEKENGNGCLKYRCFSADFDTDSQSEFTDVGKMDYYTRQAYEWTTTPVVDVCVTSCGQEPTTLYGTRFCKQLSDGSKVDDAICNDWTPTMPRPKIPEKKCDGTPKCVSYKTSTPAQNGKHCHTNCGHSAETLSGDVWCEETKSGKRVGDGKCNYWGQHKPSMPTQWCSATETCANWKPYPAPGACPTQCGVGGSSYSGSVKCLYVNGQSADDSVCYRQHGGNSRPGNPIRHCAAKNWGSGNCFVSAPRGQWGGCYNIYGGCNEEMREGWDGEERRECFGSGHLSCVGGYTSGNHKYIGCYRSGNNCYQNRL